MKGRYSNGKTDRPSVRLSHKHCNAIRFLKNEWKTENYDEIVERLFIKCSESDPELKKKLERIDYFLMETKLNEDAAIVK